MITSGPKAYNYCVICAIEWIIATQIVVVPKLLIHWAHLWNSSYWIKKGLNSSMMNSLFTIIIPLIQGKHNVKSVYLDNCPDRFRYNLLSFYHACWHFIFTRHNLTKNRMKTCLLLKFTKYFLVLWYFISLLLFTNNDEINFFKILSIKNNLKFFKFLCVA